MEEKSNLNFKVERKLKIKNLKVKFKFKFQFQFQFCLQKSKIGIFKYTEQPFVAFISLDLFVYRENSLLEQVINFRFHLADN